MRDQGDLRYACGMHHHQEIRAGLSYISPKFPGRWGTPNTTRFAPIRWNTAGEFSLLILSLVLLWLSSVGSSRGRLTTQFGYRVAPCYPHEG